MKVEMIQHLLWALQEMARVVVADYDEIENISVEDENAMFALEDIKKLVDVAVGLYPFTLGCREDLFDFLVAHWPETEA